MWQFCFTGNDKYYPLLFYNRTPDFGDMICDQISNKFFTEWINPEIYTKWWDTFGSFDFIGWILRKFISNTANIIRQVLRGTFTKIFTAMYQFCDNKILIIYIVMPKLSVFWLNMKKLTFCSWIGVISAGWTYEIVVLWSWAAKACGAVKMGVRERPKPSARSKRGSKWLNGR